MFASFLKPLLLFSATQAFTCPGEEKDVHIELAHIQGSTAQYISHVTGLHDQLKDAFSRINTKAGGNVTFHVAATKDRMYPNRNFKCDDEYTNGFVPFDKLGYAFRRIKDKYNYLSVNAPPGVLDPMLRIINDWAGADKKKNTQRIITFATDQCLRIQGHYHYIEPSQVEGWKEDRQFELPLTGSQLNHCQIRDVPSLKEIAGEASANGVMIGAVIEGTDPKWGCLLNDKYPGYNHTVKSFYEDFSRELNDEGVYNSFDLSFKYKTGNELAGYADAYVKMIEDIVCNSSNRAVYPVFAAAFAAMILLL